MFVTVLGELAQVIPGLSKTRWRKKSDFYSLFLAFARNVERLPLAAEKRDAARAVLSEFAEQVDAVIKEMLPEGTKAPTTVTDYVKNVERAASDLATRTERDRVLNEILAEVFANG